MNRSKPNEMPSHGHWRLASAEVVDAAACNTRRGSLSRPTRPRFCKRCVTGGRRAHCASWESQCGQTSRPGSDRAGHLWLGAPSRLRTTPLSGSRAKLRPLEPHSAALAPSKAPPKTPVPLFLVGQGSCCATRPTWPSARGTSATISARARRCCSTRSCSRGATGCCMPPQVPSRPRNSALPHHKPTC